MTHPTDERLHAWVDGEVGDESARIAEHVVACADCRRRVDSVRALGGALRIWAAEIDIGAAGDLADVVLRGTTNGKSSASAPAAVPARATAPARPKRRWVWGAVPATALAVAAVFLFAIRRPHPTLGTGRGSGEHVRDAGARVAMAKATDDRPHGTVVLSVDPADERTTYSVMEVPGGQEGTTTSVVWIEDQPVDEPGTVQ
jgi:hypothetical protein